VRADPNEPKFKMEPGVPGTAGYRTPSPQRQPKTVAPFKLSKGVRNLLKRLTDEMASLANGQDLGDLS
jgi:hypothetical protein